ncbi:MAG: hypothetical protein ACRDTS_21520, partial [Mycobacterium sp.]
MIWPLKVPAEMHDGALSMRSYSSSDADPLFAALSDERSWEQIPRAIPRDALTLDAMIHAK